VINTGNGYGVVGESAYSRGVYGETSNHGQGVLGKNLTSGNQGYLGGNQVGVSGKGVGTSSGVTGSSYDGFGVTGSSTNAAGLYGNNSSSGNYGALGTPEDGVYGNSSNGNGVEGESSSGAGSGVAGHNWSNGPGVYGFSANGLAGWFQGDVKIDGDIFGKLSIVRGTVNEDGSIAEGDGFTAERDPANQLLYNITFDPPFNGKPTVTATAEITLMIVSASAVSGSTCHIGIIGIKAETFINPLTGVIRIIALPSGGFNFIAVGERSP
jgi:hypothetical protein